MSIFSYFIILLFSRFTWEESAWANSVVTFSIWWRLPLILNKEVSQQKKKTWAGITSWVRGQWPNEATVTLVCRLFSHYFKDPPGCKYWTIHAGCGNASQESWKINTQKSMNKWGKSVRKYISDIHLFFIFQEIEEIPSFQQSEYKIFNSWLKPLCTYRSQ